MAAICRPFGTQQTSFKGSYLAKTGLRAPAL